MQVLGWDNMARVRQFAIEYELITNPVYPMPNLKSTLATFQHAQIPMGIISNAQFYTPYLFEYFLDANAETLGFLKDLTIYSFETGHGKPSPYLFQLARERLQALGLKPDSVLFVGNDMLNDIYPATRPVFKPPCLQVTKGLCGFAQTTRAAQKLKPDVVITDLAQLCQTTLS